MTGDFGSDRRAVSATITYVLALGITTMLVAGILVGGSTYVEDKREQVAREQLEAVGTRLAAKVTAVSHASQSGGNVTARVTLTDRVVDSPYTARLDSNCNEPTFTAETCLRLSLTDPSISMAVPVTNDSDVELRRDGSSTFVVTSTPTGSPLNGDDGTKVEVNPNIGVGSGVDKAFEASDEVDPTNRQPISGFTYAPGTPTAGQSVTFSNDTSDLDGSIVTFAWDFDGDGTVDDNGQTVSHTFNDPGKYNVTLKVIDDDGATDNLTKTVVVSGLVYEGDAQTFKPGGSLTLSGIEFTINNTYDGQVTVTDVLIDPDNTDVRELTDEESGEYRGEREIYVGGDDQVGGSDIGGGATIYDDGRIIDLNTDGDNWGRDAELSSDSTATVELFRFKDASDDEVNMTGEPVDIAVRHEYDGTSYVSKFTIYPAKPPGTGPTPSMADVITYEGDLYSGAGVDAIAFDIEADVDLTVSNVSVDSDLSDGTYSRVLVQNQNNDWTAIKGWSGTYYAADGTSYSTGGTTIESIERLLVVDDLNTPDLQHTTNPTDADVSITLGFSDGSTKTFYFEED